MKNLDEIHALLFNIGLYDREYLLNEEQKSFFYLRYFTIEWEMSGDPIDKLFCYQNRMEGSISALKKVGNDNLAKKLDELNSFYNTNIDKILKAEDFEERLAIIDDFIKIDDFQQEICDFIFANEEIYFTVNISQMNENLEVLEANMKEIEFWNFLDRYKWEGYEEKRVEGLNEISTENLIQWCFFNEIFYKKAHKYSIWCAAEIVRGGCGDDSFHYFRNWLILQGFDIYKNALENADTLLKIFQRPRYKNRDDIQNDSFIFEIEKILEIRGIKDYEIWARESNISFIQIEKIDLDTEHLQENWADDENSLAAVCPKIYAFFRKKPLPYKVYN